MATEILIRSQLQITKEVKHRNTIRKRSGHMAGLSKRASPSDDRAVEGDGAGAGDGAIGVSLSRRSLLGKQARQDLKKRTRRGRGLSAVGESRAFLVSGCEDESGAAAMKASGAFGACRIDEALEGKKRQEDADEDMAEAGWQSVTGDKDGALGDCRMREFS